MSEATYTLGDVRRAERAAFLKGYHTNYCNGDVERGVAEAGTFNLGALDVEFVTGVAERLYPVPMKVVPREIEVRYGGHGSVYRLRVEHGEVEYLGTNGDWYRLALSSPAGWGVEALTQIADLITNPTEEVEA